MKKTQKGVIGEYLTCIEKIKENKWVFTSIDPQSPCDLITLDKDGNIELIDVKTKTYRKLNIKLLMRDFKE